MKKIIFLSLLLLSIYTLSSNKIFSNINSINSDSSGICIVSGEAIEGDGVKYLYLNKEVKFCCKGCEKSFKKEPAKYLGAAGLWCPVCNEGDAKKEISLVSSGVKYYFCGKGCKNKFSKAPETYLKNYK
ncbi:MAG: YHS domain-containing protein [Ignavibacteria bacterium]|nr:YHS domain-containing protein [Ignavibacteria bacterium]